MSFVMMGFADTFTLLLLSTVLAALGGALFDSPSSAAIAESLATQACVAFPVDEMAAAAAITASSTSGGMTSFRWYSK